MKKSVSVIIPTYKNPNTVVRAVDSVLNQKGFNDFEVIVVDDNDPESIERTLTEKAMKKYSINEKVQYIKHSKNKNGAAARNTGFKHSNGKYIAFLDDDDIFLENKLKKQYEYMEKHPEFDASYTWRIQAGKELVKYRKTGDLSKELLMLEFFPTTITIMIKSECYDALEGFDESFNRHQDFEFLLRFFEKYRIGVVEEPLSRIIGKQTKGNQLHGKEYEELKKKFLSTFGNTINRLEDREPGTKSKIFASHYADIFVSEISSRNYLLAIKTFINSTFQYKVLFIKKVYNHYINAINRRKKK